MKWTGGFAAKTSALLLGMLCCQCASAQSLSVLLTVQVDSVGADDGIIPANVCAAVNFFQHDPLTIQGRREILAADPQRTAILGNFKSSYRAHSARDPDSEWIRRTLGGGHTKMELDSAIWARVQDFICGAISRR